MPCSNNIFGLQPSHSNLSYIQHHPFRVVFGRKIHTVVNGCHPFRGAGQFQRQKLQLVSPAVAAIATLLLCIDRLFANLIAPALLRLCRVLEGRVP